MAGANFYPSVTHSELKTAIGAAYGVDPAHIVCGNGSSEIIALLAQAYADEGNTAMAALSTSEQYAAGGRLPEAKQWAERAKRELPQGSPAWQRADDISRIEKPRL